MRSASQWIERCLWTIGFLALAAWLTVWIGAKVHQAKGEQELDRRISETTPAPAPAITPAPVAPTLSEGDLIGRIDIPRLNLSSVIFEGTDASVLRDGVGHLMGSPLPGQRGNVVLAAHRDTFFRPLRYLHNHDTIDLVTPGGTREYQVISTSIVTPDHTEVLGPAPGTVLTLVTCYPFDWFGHAPKRFIVKAREIDTSDAVSTAVSAAAAPPPSEQQRQQAADVMETVGRPSPPTAPTPAPAHRAVHHHYKPYVRIAAATKVAAGPQEETEIAEDTSAPVAAPGNRFMRGLKRLNPKGLFAKLAGN